jgi:hypothetical protein
MLGRPKVAAEGAQFAVLRDEVAVLSFHVRVAVVAMAPTGFPRRENTTRSVRTSLLNVAFSAVLPLPNTSHATPKRGEMSFQLGTLSTDRKRQVSWARTLPDVLLRHGGGIESKRTPAFTVRRFTLH